MEPYVCISSSTRVNEETKKPQPVCLEECIDSSLLLAAVNPKAVIIPSEVEDKEQFQSFLPPESVALTDVGFAAQPTSPRCLAASGTTTAVASKA